MENQETENNQTENKQKILFIDDNGHNRTINYWMIDAIEESKKYIDFLDAIQSAQSNDTINIHLNCPGGYVDTAFIIYDALVNTQATVNIYGEGMIASAATFIMLAGDEIYLTPHAYVMCHNCTYGDYGKFNEIKTKQSWFEKWWPKTVKDVYKGFLLEHEIDELLEDKDFWFDADEATKRIKASREKTRRLTDLIQTLTNHYKNIISEAVENIVDDSGDINETELEKIIEHFIPKEPKIKSENKSKKKSKKKPLVVKKNKNKKK